MRADIPVAGGGKEEVEREPEVIRLTGQQQGEDAENQRPTQSGCFSDCSFAKFGEIMYDLLRPAY